MPSPFLKRMAIIALSVTLGIVLLNGVIFGPSDLSKDEAREHLIAEAQGYVRQVDQANPSLNSHNEPLLIPSANSTDNSTSSQHTVGKPDTTPLPKSIYIDSAKDRFLLTFKSECEAMGVPKDLQAKPDGPTQCPCVPEELVGRSKPDANIPTWQELESAHPDLEDGGHWRPGTCIPRQRACLFLPYRDREPHLLLWLKVMLPFMKKQNMDFRIFVTEQSNGSRFNRGMLMNAGVAWAEKAGLVCDCIIIHDVDHVPEDDRNMYFCQHKPIHLAVARNDHKYRLPYASFVGGAIAATKEDYKKVNGFSNLYFGWGSEDDDIYERFTKANHLPMKRYPTEIAYYTMFKHEHAVENKGRWKLVRAWRGRWSTDGMNDVQDKCTVSKVDKRKLVTFLHVDIDEEKVKKMSGM